jgi:ABC-type glutathione transport system ATPase component
VVGERGYTLSGGQRQRIAIARTLLVNPPILILDDATSAVDVQVEQQIHGALRKLMEGRTTLIIAHRLSTISLADRVGAAGRGAIVADGTHAELLASTPLYAEVLAQANDELESPRARAVPPDGMGRRIRSADGGRPMGRAGGAPGLPFGGIPPELQSGVDDLLTEEPDHGEPSASFSQTADAGDQRRLTLWRWSCGSTRTCWSWRA